jgi:hypothetical protein
MRHEVSGDAVVGVVQENVHFIYPCWVTHCQALSDNEVANRLVLGSVRAKRFWRCYFFLLSCFFVTTDLNCAGGENEKTEIHR